MLIRSSSVDQDQWLRRWTFHYFIVNLNEILNIVLCLSAYLTLTLNKIHYKEEHFQSRLFWSFFGGGRFSELYDFSLIYFSCFSFIFNHNLWCLEMDLCPNHWQKIYIPGVQFDWYLPSLQLFVKTWMVVFLLHLHCVLLDASSRKVWTHMELSWEEGPPWQEGHD